MGPFLHRLPRFLVFVALLTSITLVIVAQANPPFRIRVPAVAVPLLATLHAADVAQIVGFPAVGGLGVLVAGRLLGRRLRHPTPVGRHWPLRGRLGMLQQRLQLARVELELPRDALADPYEVAKLADGLSPVLRSQRRLSLRGLLGPDTLLLEQHAHPVDRTVSFHLMTTVRAMPAVLRRLQATYPGIQALPSEPDPLLEHATAPRRLLAARLRRRPLARPDVGVVRLKKHRQWVLSLQTTKDYAHSAVGSLVHQLHDAGVEATVQLVLTPTPAWVERRAGRVVRKRERTLRAQTGQPGTAPGIESLTAQKDLKGALEGVGRAYYWFDWRIITPTEGRDVADAITGALAELRQDNELRPRTIRLRAHLTAHRARRGLPPLLPGLWSGALSAAEIASCWHLPSARIHGTGLRRATTRRLAASPQISRDPHDMLLVDEHGPLGIRAADRRKGLAVLGAPGGGKSSLLLRYIGNVARDTGRALIVIDVKEDLARDALTVIPTRRRTHVLDLHHPYVGLNLLAIDALAPEVRADILIAAIRETHGEDSVGARSDSLLRAAITAVCTVEDTPTLAHVLRMLDPYEPGYRTWVVRELAYHREVDFIRDFWEREFPAMVAANPRFVAEAVAAPRNKLQRLLAVPALTLATNHPVSLDLVQIIRDREVLVINGSKAGVGEDNAVLFCQLAIMLIQRSLHRLQTIERDQRTPVALVIDEAHNVFTPSFATMLSEGRSAGLETVAAFQYTGQITDERVAKGVKSLLQNVSITRMRELDDARAIAALAMELFSDAIRLDPDEQLKQTIDPLDIVNAPDYQLQNLWLVDGTPQPVFTATTLPVEPVLAQIGGQAREHHEREQARRGDHPHDRGQPIAPPLIWDAATPAIARHRNVYVDLTGWTERPDVAQAEVTITLRAPDAEHAYPARLADRSGRRLVATASGGDGPTTGVYPVAVRAVDRDGHEHRWTPTVEVLVDERRQTVRHDPATVELTDPPAWP